MNGERKKAAVFWRTTARGRGWSSLNEQYERIEAGNMVNPIAMEVK
jgi:hypothetical protein